MTEARRPATAEQTEVWLAMQREPESARFTVPLDLEFTPGVDVVAPAFHDRADPDPA